MKSRTLIGLALAVAVIVGCATNRTLYNTLSTARAMADSSVAAYYDLVVRGEATTNGVPKVSQAYNMFNASFSVAVDIARLETNSVTPPIVTSSLSNLLWTITEVKGLK